MCLNRRWCSSYALGARGAIDEQIVGRCLAWISGQLKRQALCSTAEQCSMLSCSHLYCTLFFATSDRHSGTHRPREIRRSIRRRWDICTSLLVEPPCLRAHQHPRQNPSAIPCIHRITGACLPSPSCGVVVPSLFLTPAMFPPSYRTRPFQLLKSSFPSFQV